MANLLGFGDILTAQYGRSQGLNDGYVGYSLPIASDDTRVSLRYDKNGVVVITPELSPLNTTSSFSSVGVGLSRPMYRTPEQTFTLGAQHRKAAAADVSARHAVSLYGRRRAKRKDGRDTCAPLSGLARPRLPNTPSRRGRPSASGFRRLGATVVDTSLPGTPTAKFFSWLGQAQYVRRIYEDWEILLRSDLQLANKPLFQMEQIAFGGLGSVRGYRTYLTVTDDGFLGLWRVAYPGRPAAAPLSRRFGYRRDRADRAVLRLCQGLEHSTVRPFTRSRSRA